MSLRYYMTALACAVLIVLGLYYRKLLARKDDTLHQRRILMVAAFVLFILIGALQIY